MVNTNPYGNGLPIFSSGGEAARGFQRGVQVGMIGSTCRCRLPSVLLLRRLEELAVRGKRVHGPESINFFGRPKVVTSRSPHLSHASFHFPAAKSPRASGCPAL